MVPPKRESTEASLTSLDYLIKDACGNDTDNIVDFGYLKAILLIFTRHLNLLDRQVSVNLQHAQIHKKESQHASNIVVGEIKVVAKGQKTDKQGAHNVSAIESHQERILFVERRASTTSSTGYTLEQTPQSLVTKEQFKTIVNAVKRLEERFGNTDSQLIESFHQKSYLSDPIGVIQLSARLEVVERAIEDIMKFLVGIKSEKETLKPQIYKSIRENTTDSTVSKAFKKNRTDVLSTFVYEFESDEPEMKLENIFSIKSNKLVNDIMQPLTSESFRRILLGFADEMAEIVQRKCFSITLQSKSVSQHVTIYIGKFTEIMNKIQTTTHLENKFKEFVDGVNKLDTKLRNSTAHFYETISLMQIELDTALDRAKEVLMTPLPENKAIPRLIHNMENLLLDIQTFGEYQDDLHRKQNSLAERLKVLKKQIGDINLFKVNRVQLYKALQSKIDLSAINKLMSEGYTFAYLGKLQQYIIDLHRYLHEHELSWQDCIDDYWRRIEKKANAVDFNAIKNDIFENLNHIDEHLDYIISLRSTNDINKKEDRKIILHELCISCNRPATVERIKLKASKRKKTHKDNDETKICCPNHPIPHPIHPGSNCAKFCTCPHKTLTDIKTNTIPEDLTTSVIVNSSIRNECDMQKVTNGIMRHRGPCDTSEWEKITLKHNLKFRQQPVKLIPTIASKQSIASHGTKKSQESIASLQRKSKHDAMTASLKRVNINYSEPLGFDIETTSEALYVVDLDEDVLSQYF